MPPTLEDVFIHTMTRAEAAPHEKRFLFPSSASTP